MSDIPDKKIASHNAAEEPLRQAQHLEAVGRLAASMAHDFNNILTIIQGHIGLLLDESSLSAAMRESLEPVATAADRAALLTRQLLAFSRKQVLQMRLIDLNDLVGDTASMLQRLLGETIVLSFNYCPSAAVVEGDTTMLEQIVVNLAVNARDAMPDGGRLSVCTEATSGAENAGSDPWVRLSVADGGGGISDEIKKQIFDPFFSTKERGTGLGLAVVRQIVEGCGGRVEVHTHSGRGSCFEVWLPIASPVASKEK